MARIVEILTSACQHENKHEACQGEWAQPGGRVTLLCTCEHHEEEEDAR